MAGARHVHALAMRIYVHHILHLVGDSERRQEGNRLRAAAPEHNLLPLLRPVGHPLPPGGMLRRHGDGESLDLFGQRPHRSVCANRRRRTPGRPRRLDHEVLVVVVGPHVPDVEAAALEQIAQRRRCKIGAVLVVHVPEAELLQDERHLGNLEEEHGVRVPFGSAAYHRDERLDGGDMLERHLAADEIRFPVGVALGIEVRDEGRQIALRRAAAVRDIGRIEAGAAVLAQIAQQGKELALAAADLDELLAVQVVPVDQPFGERTVKRVEGLREALRLLVALGVFDELLIEGAIEDESAPAAEAHVDVAARIGDGLFRRAHQHAAIHRDARDPVEAPHRRAAAGRTAGFRDSRRRLDDTRLLYVHT